MKKRTLTVVLTFLCLTNICVFAGGHNKDRENWLPILKEIYGDKQPSVKKSDTIDNAREYKYPGQRFLHIGVVQLNGKGKLVKKHTYWFDTEKWFQLQHQSNYTILEEIISNGDELNDGIIKSRFTIQCFNEGLVSAKAGAKLGFIESNDIINALKHFQKNHGEEMDKLGDKLISLSSKALATSIALVVAPEPVVTKGTAVVTAKTAFVLFGMGVILKTGNWAGEKLAAKTDEDGNIILSREEIQHILPEADMMIKKLHRIEGTTIETTWVAQNGERPPEEIGYTQLEIVSKNPDITEEDKEMLAKMVYRMNPFGVKSILPDDKKGSGGEWTIDANDVVSWMSTAGINYDTVYGVIRVKDFGSDKSSKYEDENVLQGKDGITVTTLKAITKDNDRLRFMKKLKDKSQVKMSVIPTAGKIVVVTPETGVEAPNYVKEVNVNGRIESHIDKPIGLLEDIVYETNSVSINYAYTQMRMPMKKAK